MKKSPSEVARPKSEVWQKTPTPHLFRFVSSGTYYLRARFGGKQAYRQSLKTDNYQIARARLDKRMAELKAIAPTKAGWAPTTLWDALRFVRAQVDADPSLKKRSKAAYGDVLRSLDPAKPYGVPVTPLPKLSPAEIDAWWERTADYFSPARANYQLLFLRRALKVARESGALGRDLAAHLHNVPVPRTRLKLITSAEFAAIVAAVRALPLHTATQSADWIEFVAYSGLRPEEANSVTWEHIDRVANMLIVVGAEEGTKNRQIRRVPITEQLDALLKSILARRGDVDGPILTVRDPSRAIKGACKILGLPPLRRYDLRHLFATRCNEAGVDVPTFAKWLGHKDGGALAMRTYVHPHEEHEQRSAAKVRF